VAPLQAEVLALVEELSDSRVFDQLSANHFKIIAALQSEDAEIFVQESARQKCPRPEQISYSNVVSE
jgi:hypothetical protein